MKTFISRTLLISLTLLLSSSVQVYAQSFTEPPSAPPNNNAYAPLDTSSQGQAKAGGLDLNSSGAPNGLIVEQGNVGIGTPTPATTLNVIGKVGAAAYCDVNGNNCTTSLGSGPLPSYNDLPSGAMAGWCNDDQAGDCFGATAPAFCAAQPPPPGFNVGASYYCSCAAGFTRKTTGSDVTTVNPGDTQVGGTTYNNFYTCVKN